jgi:hypothetical protein
MIKRLLLAGLLVGFGFAQATRISVSYQSDTSSCFLNEYNQGRIELNDGVAINIVRVDEEPDGTLVLVCEVEVRGEIHAEVELRAQLNEPIILACNEEGSNDQLIIVIEP